MYPFINPNLDYCLRLEPGTPAANEFTLQQGCDITHGPLECGKVTIRRNQTTFPICRNLRCRKRRPAARVRVALVPEKTSAAAVQVRGLGHPSIKLALIGASLTCRKV